jgi:protoporphyrinogen oxidase
MSRPPVVVLGAGCAGLAAAWRLRSKGRDVLVVEAEDHVGGLAGGVRLNGNTYEYGPHIFHTTDPDILADVKSIMGAELLPYKRTIQIKFLGNYFRFPLSTGDVLRKLPPAVVLKAALSFAYRFVEGALRRPDVENSETVLKRYYGDVLYKLFFKDYIEHVWGVPPAGFSPAFARERIPRFNFLEWADALAGRLKGSLGLKKIQTSGYVEKVEGELYTTRQGFSLITQRMSERLTRSGAVLSLNTEVLRINRSAGRVVSVTVRRGGAEETLSCSGVVNTLAVNEAALSVTPGLGEEAERAAARLRFRAIVFVGVKVRRPKVLRASFMYFREHSFNRITDLSHFAFQIDPPGSTLLVAEVTCDPSDRVWSDEALVRENVLADLEREGILSRGEVEETHVFRARHAQPMYTLGYEKALATLLAAFAGLENLETCGRQGRFQYVNTHVAMKMGYEAADRLLTRLEAR